MSSLILVQNGLTERHDSLLSMLFEWATTPALVKVVLSKQLGTPRILDHAAKFAWLTARGEAGSAALSEPAVAKVLLGFFLMDRTVRRALAKHQSRTRGMRKGEAMLAMTQLRDQLLVLVEGQIGQA